MKKVFSVFLAAALLLCIPCAALAAEVFGAPAVTLLNEKTETNDILFTFSLNGGDAAGYERQRQSVYNRLLAQYGSSALAEAALKAAGQETLLYPTLLLAEIELDGLSAAVRTYPITDTRFTVSLQNDVLPALAELGLYTHDAFTFRLCFYAVMQNGVTPTYLSGGTHTGELGCPQTAHIVYDLPADAENPNPAFPFLPYKGFTLAYPSRPGYTFAGWISGETGGYVSSIAANTLDLSLSAAWTPRTYKINYVLTTREGFSFAQVNNSGNPKTRVYGEETPIYDVTPPYGYLFAGWYETPDCTGERVTSVPADRLGDTLLYAKWRTQQEADDEFIKEKGYGDVNGDGGVTAADARLALRAAVKLETLSKAALDRANLTGSGIITAETARLILRVAVKLDDLAEVLRFYGVID